MFAFSADPLRPSAGGAEPDPVTSDALCRPGGAYAGRLHTFALAAPRFSAPLSRGFVPRCVTAAARTRSAAACLRQRITPRPGRLPSA
jgi:hypothetical protein